MVYHVVGARVIRAINHFHLSIKPESDHSFYSPLNKPYKGLVPAIGGLTHVRTSTSIGSHFELPPSPVIPPPQLEMFQHVKTYDIDPDSLLPGVIDDLAAVAQAWRIDAQPSDDDLLRTFDVLSVLKTTTRTIRSIRNYLLSLGDESASTIRAHFRPKLLGPGDKPQSTTSSTQPDPLSLIRRSALEVLTVLRELEERCRLPLSDDAYDVHSDGGSRGTHSHVATPSNNLEELPPEDDLRETVAHLEADTSFTFSVMQVKGKSVPVWEDEDDEFEQPVDEKEKPEPWDERLVVGSGWLYRQDVNLKELEKERNVIATYLDVVDEVLFEWKRNEEAMERGWEKERRKAIEKGDRIVSKAKARRVSSGDSREISAAGMLLANIDKRRVSTGMLDSLSGITLTEEPELLQEEDEGELSVDDEELPPWAQRSAFVNDGLGKALDFIMECNLARTSPQDVHMLWSLLFSHPVYLLSFIPQLKVMDS